jgi:pentatricopeptide repeat protein
VLVDSIHFAKTSEDQDMFEFQINSLMDGVDEATEVFALMISKGCMPNIISYNILINGYCQIKQIDEAKQLFDMKYEMSNKWYSS